MVEGFERRNMLVGALRAAIMLIGGLLALFWPGGALATLISVGGALMVVDGGLGLWRLAFGGRRARRFWLAVVRGLVGVVTGLLIVGHPFGTAAIGAPGLVYLVAALALLVGALEMAIVFSERREAPPGSFWPSLLGGALYVAFGLLLFFLPLAGAIDLVRIGGVLMLAYGLFLVWEVWSARRDVLERGGGG